MCLCHWVRRGQRTTTYLLHIVPLLILIENNEQITQNGVGNGEGRIHIPIDDPKALQIVPFQDERDKQEAEEQ